MTGMFASSVELLADSLAVRKDSSVDLLVQA
jgi:hypothetical protein